METRPNSSPHPNQEHLNLSPGEETQAEVSEKGDGGGRDPQVSEKGDGGGRDPQVSEKGDGGGRDPQG